jgi:hypothetical protein
VEKESFSDGFVVEYHVSGRVSGCCGEHLDFTANAATHTRYHVKRVFFLWHSLHICRATTTLTITFVNTRFLSSKPHICCSGLGFAQPA